MTNDQKSGAERLTERVGHVVDEHTAPEHPRKYATTDEPATAEDALLETQRDTEGLAPIVGSGIMTNAQSHGFLLGALIGGGIGAVLVGPFGFLITMGELSVWVRILIMAIIGALAGGTVGVVYLMGRMPELEGETTGLHNQPMDGTTPRDPGTDDRGRQTGEPTGPV